VLDLLSLLSQRLVVLTHPPSQLVCLARNLQLPLPYLEHRSLVDSPQAYLEVRQVVNRCYPYGVGNHFYFVQRVLAMLLLIPMWLGLQSNSTLCPGRTPWSKTTRPLPLAPDISALHA
jgi:hypothetical protein